ncbi:hypothetical protein QJ857_gp0660 [Tupanvirus soda lake]|uniref:Uncharacterized protein n=2 Tax=Tupanvirus TaxID=2094720 RepID=A0A6N1NVQ6_9VIRU|nr:hypothetical protein QJ857_gp0660 [Tupanvirus soda lake]QKU35383.1 hypothetical protein [Tupanvirus soda lake]
MRRSEMRGGADEYKINDVLGPNFVLFANMLKGGDLKNFTFDKYGRGLTTTSTTAANLPKPNDIHYDFVGYLMAAAAAFRQIENPDVGKATTASKYAGNIYAMVDELVSGKATSGIINPPQTDFGFAQLPFHEHGTVKYLVPGFNLLPYVNTVYPNHSTTAANGLVNAVRYLYHFISLLKLDGLDARDVMILLRADNLGFMGYINQIVDTLAGSVYFTEQSPLPTTPEGRSIIRDGVLNGLTAVAVQIINEFRNLPTVTGVIPVPIDQITAGIDTAPKLIKFFEAIGVPEGGTPGTDDYATLLGTALAEDNLYDIVTHDEWVGTNVDKTIVPDDLAKAYLRNGVYNPVYVDGNYVETSIDTKNLSTDQKTLFADANLMRGGRDNDRYRNKNDNRFRNWDNNSRRDDNMRGGGGPGALILFGGPTGGGKAISFPFLYGPRTETATSKRYLITQEQPDAAGAAPAVGGKTYIVNPELVKTIYDAGNNKTIVPRIAAFGTPNDNGVRVVLLSLLDFILTNRLNDWPATAARSNDILNQMRTDLQNYTTVANRIRRIPTNVEAVIAKFRDHFVTEFTRATYKNFNIDPTGKLGVRPPAVPAPTGVTKSNLTDDTVWNFYDQVASTNETFYKQFFNLIRMNQTSASNGQGFNEDAPFTEAKNARADERANYRLNVRKRMGFTRLSQIQFGGTQMFGDIELIGITPVYPTDGSVGDVWITQTQKITRDRLIAELGGPEAIRSIVRMVYNTPQNTQTVDILGIRVDLVEIARRIGTTGLFVNNYPDFIRNYLKSLARDDIPKSVWKEGEMAISEHMLREGNLWERQGDEFIRKKRDGTPDDVKFEDNCKFIGDNTRECLDVLTQCLPATDQASYEANCGKLLQFNFAVNPGMATLKEEVQKINPAVAFAILRQLRFGSYLDTEEHDPVQGFRRYKVQSVGSWLEELMTGVQRDACQRPMTAPATNAADFQCGNLRQQLGALADTIIAMAQDDSKRNFFNYLDVLVHWVNANPQVLNPEELMNPKMSGLYPQIKNSYKTYSYVNPYKPAEIRLRGVACGLERLKSNIMNELSGVNAGATISTIANVPLGIEMPLSRHGFASPIPFGGLLPMAGGSGIFETEHEMQNLYQPYGYNLFNDIYKDLLHTMANLVGKDRDIKLGLTDSTRSRIESKLENFRQSEKALIESLKNLVERNKLYQASRGHVNSYIEDPNKYAAILSKHSNLLNLSSAYNRRAVNLIDLFQTIAKTILGKIDETNKGSVGHSGSSYNRPMTMGYHFTKKTQ